MLENDLQPVIGNFLNIKKQTNRGGTEYGKDVYTSQGAHGALNTLQKNHLMPPEEMAETHKKRFGPLTSPRLTVGALSHLQSNGSLHETDIFKICAKTM